MPNSSPTSQPPVHADLHTHTTCSDGELSPSELVSAAADRDIRVLAVTDHDTVAALGAAEEAASDVGIDLLPGVELSVTTAETEVHLLAYGFDPSDTALRDHLRWMRDARRSRAWDMVERLREEGLDVADEQLEAEIDGAAAVGRPHVAAALVRAGHVDTPRQAFERYIGTDGPGYVAKPAVSAEDALALVHGAGGVGVLAHPGHGTSSAQIRRLSEAGLDGIEVCHPAHRPYLQRYYERVAQGYGFLRTGGSDYHGRTETEERTFGTVGMTQVEWERFRAAGP
jgi:hypothetical protein